MLTAEMESGLLKAHNYWNKKRYGPMHLNFLSEHRASLEPAKIHRRHDKPTQRQFRGPTPRSPNARPEPRTPGGRTPGGSRTPGGPKTPRSEQPLTSDQPYMTVRTFTLSREDQPFEPLREITQLQYAGWPDFGAPAHPAHLLGLVEQCDAVMRAGQAVPLPPSPPSRSRTSTGGPSLSPVEATSGPAPLGARPVVVHCSAGCGRTGTFCAVDSVVDMLKRRRGARRQPPSPETRGEALSSLSLAGEELDDEVDLVERTVRDFRGQRLSMVQNLRQFVLCYESVLEWLAT